MQMRTGSSGQGQTIGYLAQHQDDTAVSFPYMILSWKHQEACPRYGTAHSGLEVQMKHASGEELARIMELLLPSDSEFELENGYSYQSEITGVLKGLGFTEEEFSKPVTALSGGQKTRVSLGVLLLPNRISCLLDEPTNHLDMESIAWLETYLLNYQRCCDHRCP